MIWGMYLFYLLKVYKRKEKKKKRFNIKGIVLNYLCYFRIESLFYK